MKWTNKGHELDSVASRLAPKKYLYIYGAGENGKYTYDRVKFLPTPVCFIDGNPEKQRNGYLGCQVVSLEEALRTEREELLVIVAVSNINRPNVVKILTVYGLR